VYFVANTKLPLNGGSLPGIIDTSGNKIGDSNPNLLHKNELVQMQWIETKF